MIPKKKIIINPDFRRAVEKPYSNDTHIPDVPVRVVYYLA